MREAHDLLDRHRRAERVRHLRDGDHLRARAEQLLEFVDEEIAVLVDRRPLDHRAVALAQEVPGDDVGVVLHDREHDLVAFLDALLAERVGDEVDRLGGVAGEDDLFLAAGIDEGPCRLARALIGLRRLVGEEMQATMDVGVFARIGLGQPVEHGLRLLRRGGVVEIDERLAVNLHRQRREIGADLIDVVAAVPDRGVRHAALARSQWMAAFISASRMPSCAISSTVSPMKAWIRSASASASEMPRDIR